MFQPPLPPDKRLPAEINLARARGGLAWIFITLLLGWLSESGIGFFDYLRMLKELDNSNTSLTPIMATHITFFVLFLAAFGQILGEELASLLWLREKQLLHQNDGKGTLRQNLMRDPFEWMVTVHAWVDQIWAWVPVWFSALFTAGALLERVARLARRALCFFAGLVGTMFLILYLRFLGLEDSQTLSMSATWMGMTVGGILATLFALAFTTMPPITLILVIGLAMVYSAIMGILAGNVVLAQVVILIQGGFLLLVTIRRIRVWIESGTYNPD